MNDNRSRDIFYGVVAVATLIIALIGATLAYFSISASSNEGAVSAVAATVSIEYNDGQKVIAQASELIPATLDVVKQVYQMNLSAINAQAGLDEEEERSNVCLDSNGKEVCSVYRFSVSSDVERRITATLNNEYNGFTYLAYAVRDVNAGTWLALDGTDQFISLTKCDETETVETGCYTSDASNKTYNTNVSASNSIFGYSGTNLIDKPITATTQSYDLVIFLKENNDNQNVDQGKEYRGTIVVNVVDTDEANGRITGCVGDNC